MAKLSGNYEVVYILNPNLGEEATAAMVENESKPEFPRELDRILRITDGVMRSLIVCKDE